MKQVSYSSIAPSKKRKKSKRKRPVPASFFRSLITTWQYGEEITAADRKIPHANSSRRILDWMFGDAKHPRGLTNDQLVRNSQFLASYHYTAAGYYKSPELLSCIDVDADDPRKAEVVMADIKRDPAFANLFTEPSDNTGQHGYLIVVRERCDDSDLHAALDSLQAYLRAKYETHDVTIEIKGRPPIIKYDGNNRIIHYGEDAFAKVPRGLFNRYDEFYNTTRLTVWELFDLEESLDPIDILDQFLGEAADDDFLDAYVCDDTKRSLMTTVIGKGSVSPWLRKQKEWIETIGMIIGEKFCASLPKIRISGKKRVEVKPVDVAIAYFILDKIRQKMNTNGGLPTKRIVNFWAWLQSMGVIDRGFDGSRFKIIRDHMTKLGWIDWTDNTYWFDAKNPGSGRCCKWCPNERFVEATLEVENEGQQLEEMPVAEVVSSHEGGEGGLYCNTYPLIIPEFVENDFCFANDPDFITQFCTGPPLIAA